MVRCLSLAVVAGVLLSTSAVSAKDLASRILEYFPDKWEAKSDEGGYSGTVEWKLVAGGKGVAGPSVSVKGVKVSGDWRTKIIDQDHFEVTQETSDGRIVGRWRRIR